MRLSDIPKSSKPSKLYLDSVNKQAFVDKKRKNSKKEENVENKKIKNAKNCTYNSISFKSGLELYCYKMLLMAKLPFNYEKNTYTLFQKNKLITTKAFIYNTVNKTVKQKSENVRKRNIQSVQQTTYTPDFTMETETHIYIIETKGVPNDVYPLKRKMFLSQMEQTSPKPVIFLEPHTQREVRACIYDIVQHINYIKQSKNGNF